MTLYSSYDIRHRHIASDTYPLKPKSDQQTLCIRI